MREGAAQEPLVCEGNEHKCLWDLKHFLSLLWGAVRMCVGRGWGGAPVFQLLLLLCTAPNLHSMPYPPSRLLPCSCWPAPRMPTKPSLGEGCLIPMVALGLLVWHKLWDIRGRISRPGKDEDRALSTRVLGYSGVGMFHCSENDVTF